jgi:hypothetical protein
VALALVDRAREDRDRAAAIEADFGPSKLGAAARSMVLDMPRPRSLPRFFDSDLRLAKPRRRRAASAMSMPFSNSPES